MQKADNLILRFNAPLIIAASITNNMTIGQLVDHGYSTSSLLIYRSTITFLITIILSAGNGAALLPKNLRQQGLFMLNAGISLFLLFQSYMYLTASTVAMVQRLDIPFAVILGYVLGKRKKDFRLALSIFAVGVVCSIFLFATKIQEQPRGLLMAIVAIMMTSYSYLLIKKSTGQENNFVIVNTVNIGCIIVGLVSGLIAGNLSIVKPGDIPLFAGASLSQFLLNYSMAVLFKHHDIERGRRPYLISVLMVLVVEQLWTGRLFDFRHSGIVILVVGLMYLVTLKRLPFSKKTAAEDAQDEIIEPV